MKDPVIVPHELLCEAIGELEQWADAQENGGDKLNLQCAKEIRAIIRKLDKQRMRRALASKPATRKLR